MTDKPIWRVLPWRTDDAYTCMAIDKVIAETVATGGPPTIRFYHWAGNGAVSFGASQAIADFDTAYCEQQGIQYVRRFTEARTMYHGPTDLTYALAVPVSQVGTKAQVGAFTSSQILFFLEQLGIENATQSGYTSVIVQGRKISGSVPYFEGRRALFQHGSIFCDMEYERIAHACKESEEELRATTTAIHEERRELRCSLNDLDSTLQTIFLVDREWEISNFTEQEQARVDELKRFFATEQWLLGGSESRGMCSKHYGPPVPRFVTTFLGRVK